MAKPKLYRGRGRKNVRPPVAEKLGYLTPSRAYTARPTNGHAQAVGENFSEITSEQPEAGRSVLSLYQDALKAGAQGEVAGRPDLAANPVARQQYAALEVRREIVAVALGSGATLEEAAARAGVVVGTVNRYLEDPELRSRVDEMRAIVRSRVGGRIEAWMERKTDDPRKLDETDPRLVLNIYDRIAPVRGGNNVHIEQNNVAVNHHAGLMDRLARVVEGTATTVDAVDGGTQSGDFPVVGSDRPGVASGGSSG